MLSRLVLFLGVVFVSFFLKGQNNFETPYEHSGKKQTATYDECVAWYKKLNLAFKENTTLDTLGIGDAGKPIYVFVIKGTDIDAKGSALSKVKLLINNNIHPGEPEGTDASMLFARELLTQLYWRNFLRNLEIHIICQYNVDGTLARTCCSRANQNGPEEYGFRANARNLDLNRDFVKCDSRNAKAFVDYFVKQEFQFFIDNHTSDGADYQHTLTYFHTRPEKIDPLLARSLSKIDSILSANLKRAGTPAVPYVETLKQVPDSGIYAFWETPRYATGFAALHHALGFTVETHMLKPFEDRVAVTQLFLEEFVKSINLEKFIVGNRYRQIKKSKAPASFVQYLNYKLNTQKHDLIPFKGYQFEYVPSGVTGQNKLYYNHSKPFEKNIPYYRYYHPVDSAKLPRYYLVPFAFAEVLERLKLNGIAFTPLNKDTFIKARFYYITNYETAKFPYEGHYLHNNIQTVDTTYVKQFFARDLIVEVNGNNAAFLSAVLEPRAPDSYFAWNFFDGILMQKEWYSDYVFEEKALQILNENPVLKERFETKKKEDALFKNNASAQLLWIYRNSYYYEKSHNLYPVARIY